MRQDFSVYNESNIFTLHSRQFNNIPRAELREHQEELLKAEHLIQIELAQDDALCIRLVVDEALTEAETREWVGKQEWHLRVPDGKLAIEGGLDARLEEDFLLDEGYRYYADIPPGHYHVAVYTYLSSLHGYDCLESVGNGEKSGAYFRRTHPDKNVEDMPNWLKYSLAEAPEDDPDHEEEWDQFAQSDDFEAVLDLYFEADDPPFIEFLAHLTRTKDGAEFEVNPGLLKQVEFFGNKEWRIARTARRPALCPMGISSKF